jgi:hypothetical protein
VHNQIHEFQQFIPVTTPLGDGYLLLLANGGNYTNGIYAVVLCSGLIRWFTDDQFTVVRNDTIQVFPHETPERANQQHHPHAETVVSAHGLQARPRHADQGPRGGG